jgi:hypothetical protein
MILKKTNACPTLVYNSVGRVFGLKGKNQGFKVRFLWRGHELISFSWN